MVLLNNNLVGNVFFSGQKKSFPNSVCCLLQDIAGFAGYEHKSVNDSRRDSTFFGSVSGILYSPIELDGRAASLVFFGWSESSIRESGQKKFLLESNENVTPKGLMFSMDGTALRVPS